MFGRRRIWSLVLGMMVLGLVLTPGCQCGSDAVSLAGIIELKPDNFAFPAIAVGEQSEKTAIVSNIGQAELKISAIQVVNETGEAFALSDGNKWKLPLVLKPGESDSIRIIYAPKAQGAASGHVRIESDARNTEEGGFNRIRLFSNELADGLVFKPSPVDFGEVAIGKDKTEEVTVTNQGQVVVTISKMEIQDDADGEFAIAKALTLPQKLEVGQSATFTVRYSPRGGSAEANLLVYNDSLGGTAKLRLVGRVAAPKIVLEPEFLGFDEVKVGASDVKSFTIKNVGGMELVVSKMTLLDAANSDFSFVQAPKLPLRLAPGASKEIEMRYTAKESRDEIGTVEIDSNDPNSPKVQLQLYVQANGCGLAVSPTRLLFVRDGQKDLTVFNRGDAACQLTSFAFGAGTSAEFSFAGDAPKAQELKPNASMTFAVAFKNADDKNDKGTLEIASNDAKQPKLSVPLESRTQNAGPCSLKITPTTVQFGFVQTGFAKIRFVRLENTGTNDCNLLTANIVQNPSNVFALPKQVPTTGINIPAGQLHDLEVSYTPRDGTGFLGKLALESDDAKTPKVTVNLEGTSGKACIEVVPDPLDFGPLKVGCQGFARTLRVYNLCPNDLEIQKLNFGPNTDTQEFSLKATSLPRTVTYGQYYTAELSFSPKSLGAKLGTLEIHHSITSQSPLIVTLTAKGVTTSDQKDVFEQTNKPKVDILFVIDDSQSMQDNQRNISQNLGSFVQWATRLKVDYHMGVTTTDADCGTKYKVGGNGMCDRGNRPAIPRTGCLRGSPSYVTSQTPNAVSIFSNSVRVGLQGSGTERGLEASYQAFQPQNLQGCNKGFYRQDAALSVIYISDEPDSSPQPVAFYVNFLKSLKNGQSKHVRASSVVGPPSGCQPASGSFVKHAPSYWEIAGLLGGVRTSICSTNWSTTLGQLGVVTFGIRSQFSLSRAADPNTIQVKVDGKVIPQSASSGWTFDPSDNSINFAPGAIPDTGSTIEVSYKASC